MVNSFQWITKAGLNPSGHWSHVHLRVGLTHPPDWTTSYSLTTVNILDTSSDDRNKILDGFFFSLFVSKGQSNNCPQSVFIYKYINKYRLSAGKEPQMKVWIRVFFFQHCNNLVLWRGCFFGGGVEEDQFFYNYSSLWTLRHPIKMEVTSPVTCSSAGLWSVSPQVSAFGVRVHPLPPGSFLLLTSLQDRPERPCSSAFTVTLRTLLMESLASFHTFLAARHCPPFLTTLSHERRFLLYWSLQHTTSDTRFPKLFTTKSWNSTRLTTTGCGS